MTIDEQIKIFESNSEFERKEGDLNNCLNFRQLAEWLKELKAHREAWMNVVLEVDKHTKIYSDGGLYIRNFDVKKIIAECRPKESDTE